MQDLAIVVFAGPSLGGLVAGQWPRVIFRLPAKGGDIACAVMEGFHAIGAIDGLFETCPSPWHKEIPRGLSKGIAFFGAASMGALRAVELEPFGMIGTGRVFEGDDEVAVLHGPAEIGCPTLAEAL